MIFGHLFRLRERDAHHQGIVYIVGIIVFLLAILIVVLFFVSLPYFRQYLRERKLIRQLGLLDPSYEPWKTERRKKRWRNLFDLGVRIPALLIGGIFLVLATYHVLTVSHGMTLLFRDHVSLLALAVAVIGANIGNYFALQSKERVEILSRLSSSLKESWKRSEEGGDRRVLVTSKDYEMVWEILRAQISRQRAQSILRSAEKGGTSYYAMQKSREAQKTQDNLDAATRLRVQAQIDLLTTEPRPVGVTEHPETESLRLQVPETPVIIGFRVDDDARLIKILSIESASDSAA